MNKNNYPGDIAAAASQSLKEKAYWVNKLSACPGKSCFPYDFEPAGEAGDRREIETVRNRFPNELSSTLIRASNQSDARLLMILTAGLVLLVNKYTDNMDIIVGMPIYKQKIEADFINTVLPLRCRLQQTTTFRELLYLAKQTIDEAVANQNYPVKALLYALNLPFTGNRFPLFDIAVIVENIQAKEYIRHIPTNMNFSFLRTDDCLECVVEYNRVRYRRETVQRIIAHFIHLLGRALGNADEQISIIDPLPEEEKEKIFLRFNDTLNEFPGDEDNPLRKTLHGLFEDRVKKAPDAVVLIGTAQDEACCVTCRELDMRANRLAGLLIAKGVSPGDIVAISMDSSIPMAEAILAVLKAGAAYLPIDPLIPEERIKYMVADSNAKIIDVKDVGNRLACSSTAAGPSSPAYIIYTSGSTGRPKGVMVEHRSVVNTLVCRREEYRLDKSAVCLQLFSPAFDGFVTAFFTPLVSGAPVVLMSSREIRDIETVNRAIVRHGVTHFISVPALFRAIIETITPGEAAGLKVVTLAGDKVTPGLIKMAVEKIPGIEIAVEYGVTEVSVMSTVKRHQEQDSISVIGNPIWNTSVYILNRAQQPQPIGVPGELCLAGAGLARGYLNNPELTAEKFSRGEAPTEPLPPLYKTGDLARWLADGNIEFLGRMDHQVKIRGFRVELEEIENRLMSHPAVKEAVVAARPGPDGNRIPAAYVVPDPTRAFTVRQLLRMEKEGVMAAHRCGELPNHMPLFYLNPNEIDFTYRENIEELSYLIENRLIPGKDACIFDVGANIGTYTLLLHREARRMGSGNLRFYLFEPIPPICRVLQLNTSLYGIDANIFPYAVGAEDGEGEFTYFPKNSILSGHFREKQKEIDRLKTIIRTRHLSGERGEEMGEREIDSLLDERLTTASFTSPIRTLSGVIRENRVETIDLLKIDIGKYGPEVLAGIEDAHWPLIHRIAVEVEDIDRSLEWVEQLLKEKGYCLTILKNEDFDVPALYSIYAVSPAVEKTGNPPFEEENRDFSPGPLSVKELIGWLRQYAGETLPDYMVPASFVLLDELPVTASGKVDRRALPAPPEPGTDHAYVPPQNHIEKKLVEIWSDVLGMEKEQISVLANFFELGGHSLNATVMAAKIHKELEVKLPLAEIFRHPGIRSLAHYIDHTLKEVHVPVQPVEKREYYPLSPAQKRLYFLQQMDTAAIVYNMPQAIPWEEQIEMEMDREKFEGTFRRLIVRHESLRTSFELAGSEPVQRIHEHVEFEVGFYDLSVTPEQFVQPFDLSKAPLLRVGLVEAADGEHLVLFDMQHIITDGRSQEILIKEFKQLYRGMDLPPLKLRYKDYTLWQSSPEQQELTKRQEAYWLSTYAGELPAIDLPADYSRPLMQSFEGSSVRFGVKAGELQKLKETAAASGATLYMTLLAVFNVLLAKLSGQDDIIVGTPVAARRHADLQPIIGMFVNTLPMRNYPSGDKTFTGFLKEVKENTLAAHENQEYQFEELVDKLSVRRDTGRNPVFDVVFVLQNQEEELKAHHAAVDPGTRRRGFEIRHTVSKFDITLEGIEIREELFFSLEYCIKLFKAETIERFITYFKTILSFVLIAPSEKISAIEIITEEEKRQVLYDFNDTDADFPGEKTIHQLFEEQAARTPGNIAVKGRTPVTYRELNEKSDLQVSLLREKGLIPGGIAAIKTERSLDMIVGILAILKSGSAYLPIDPDYPEERINYMLTDSNAKIIDVKDVGNRLACSNDFMPPCSNNSPTAPGPSGLAYIIYTSGSTGKPRGVMVEHRSVINRLNWMQRRYPIDQTDVILQKTPFVFDVSVWELFWWGFRGASLCLLDPGGEKDPAAIIEAVETNHVTTMHFVPSMLSAFLDFIEDAAHPKRLSGLKRIFSSGEALSVKQVETFNRLLNESVGTELINLYGPTEATVDVSYFDCSGGKALDKVPIGKPIDNIKLYVVSNTGELQPIGIAGELCISGVGVARGYLNNPELTAEKFDKSSGVFKPDVSYKTGDLARWLPDGNIEFLGRMDHQVKVRGFRIELGEIESQLETFPAVKKAVVIAGETGAGDSQLIAYLIPDEIRAFPVRRLEELKRNHRVNGQKRCLLPNGMSVFCLNPNETDFMYREIFEERSYMKHGIALKKGACVFDVGANIGLFSLLVNQMCEDAEIYSFEPVPPVHELLTLNTFMYGPKFRVFDFGISSRSGDVDFTYYPHATILSGAYADIEQDKKTVKAFIDYRESEDGEAGNLSGRRVDELLAERLTVSRFTCPVRTLSGVIRENRVEVIDLLKIDVEKGEKEVLMGIEEADWPRIRQLVMEVHDVDGRLEWIVQLLERHRFRVFVEQETSLRETALYNLYAVSSREPGTGGTVDARDTGADTPGEPPVVWYSPEQLAGDLKDHLKKKLPDYMIPSYFVPVGKISLTPNGKLDRNALPPPEIQLKERYVAPAYEKEKEIADTWKRVLGLEVVGINDNFFDAGGNSIKILKLALELEKQLGREIPVAKMFQYPTVASFAAYLDSENNVASLHGEKKENHEFDSVKIKSRFNQRRSRGGA